VDELTAPTEGFFNADGIGLHYLDWGGDGAAMILLPGLGGTANIYGSLAPRLAERFRVASLTRRAHGQSDRPDGGYDIDTLVEDIRRFLDHLGIDRAILVGHSWAGIEIPLFATKYPDRLAAAIYLDGVHVLLEPRPDPAQDPALAVLETQPRPADVLSEDAYIAFIKRARPDLAGIWCDAIEADQREYTRSLVRYGPARAIAAKMDEGLGPHRMPDYAAVRVPQLAFVLGGTTHPFLAGNASAELRRAANTYYIEHFRPWLQRRTDLFRQSVPGATVIELDTSNHTIFIARERETITAISDFVGSESEATTSSRRQPHPSPLIDPQRAQVDHPKHDRPRLPHGDR
jgi:pimeloyl-ACP methyl ester carboxylesterase